MHKNAHVFLEDVPCYMGCEENDELLFSSCDLFHALPGQYNVVRCRTCGLMRTNPRPSPESIGIYYPDNYAPYLGSMVNQNDKNHYSRVKQFFKPVVNWIFNFNGTVLPQLTPGRMLEVGCASGSFLHHMAAKDWIVQGIEFSESAAQAARLLGYKVHTGSLENAPKPHELFDLIVGWMVLEHLHDPIGGLRKLKEWSKPDAWLVFSVPNANSFEFNLFKEKGFALQLPTHLQHFTPQTLAMVLQESGWYIYKIYHQRTLSNIIGSIGFVLRDKGCDKLGDKLIKFPSQGGLVVYLLYPLAWLLSLFGQTGRMTVWAKKLNNEKHL
jgi:2-polyprenyl-3-methyl-5-hydroxy-6-metoxy-1,4-benzoquinol methylase